MKHRELHSWDVSASEAVEIQKSLRAMLRVEPLPANVRYVAGADISFERFSDVVHAGFVVLDALTRAVVAKSIVTSEARFPYVPGLLTFREGPSLIEAWEKLDVEPDVVVFDGHGIAHPRRLGIAAHMGLVLDKPSIGCGKTILAGRHGELGEEPGSVAPLVHRGETVGVALRTKRRVAPVYVSIGHRAELDGAVALLMGMTAGYRLPEPTRQAHLAMNAARVAARPA
ncbi:MAG: endonuclease [Myxococcaceae bacterium]|nr:endonuclease [Myxococcaceae bacterium]